MIREIVQYGHPVLRQRCRPVTEVDDKIIELVGDMLDTMVAANGEATACCGATKNGEITAGTGAAGTAKGASE